LLDEEQLALGLRVCVVGIVGARREFDDAWCRLPVGEVHVEAPRVREVGVEGEAQKTLLRPRRDALADVEKRRRGGLQPPSASVRTRPTFSTMKSRRCGSPARTSVQPVLEPVDDLRELHAARDVGRHGWRRWRRGPGKTTRAAGERREGAGRDRRERSDDDCRATGALEIPPHGFGTDVSSGVPFA